MSTTKSSWEWNKDNWGYDGVHTHNGNLCWFTHKHNPHGGGGASNQSFEHFLEHGPQQRPPADILAEIQKAVEELVKES